MDYQRIIDQIASEISQQPPVGTVADYIPELSKVNPDCFGMALHSTDGGVFSTGDCEERFSTQSISKVFGLALALTVSPSEVWKRVGVEPSGNPFNSLVQLEYESGKPRNPFINAGSIVVADILLSLFDDPRAVLLDLVRTIAGEPTIVSNERVAHSELQCGFRNEALASLMKSFGNIRWDVADVLDLYVFMCAIDMNCRELARACLFFADDQAFTRAGFNVSPKDVRRINSLMLTCGFYDEAGEFAYSVGLPGKSGVGGGIVAVCPRQYSVAVWSPRLNRRSNSAMGTFALKRLTDLTNSSIF
jgi:glutaminase